LANVERYLAVIGAEGKV